MNPFFFSSQNTLNTLQTILKISQMFWSPLVCHIFQANGQAALGKYEGGSSSAAGDESLFVAKHVY